MKILKYNLCTKVNHGTKENPKIEEILSPVSMPWSEANEKIAKTEAHNGDITIEDDGKEETIQPTAEERLTALESAMLEMMGVSVND